MLKRIALICVALGLLASAGCNMDASKLAGAGEDLLNAATLTDDELFNLGRQSAAQMDKQATVAGKKDKYTKRLNKIVAKMRKYDGLDLNYKVYKTNDINAFALPDGSIRVFSGLMDIMNDNELAFVIGHEIGHVKDGDAADKFKMAYATSAARKAAGAAGGVAAQLSESQLGEIGEKFMHAQFSQKQESDADKYGFNMMGALKKPQAAAVSALRKLADPNRKGSMFDSHPDSDKRADTLEALLK